MRIVRTPRYTKDLKRLRASAAEVSRLEDWIVANPLSGDVIPGLAGVRNVRFALSGQGKRGGGRAIYFVQVSADVLIMIYAYSKSSQSDLTAEQRRSVLALVKELTVEKRNRG